MALKRIKNLDVWSDLFPYGDKIDNTNQILLWCNSVYKVKFPQHNEKTASRLTMHDFQFCFLLCILQNPFAITFLGHTHDCSSQVFLLLSGFFPPPVDRSQQFTPCPWQSVSRELSSQDSGLINSNLYLCKNSMLQDAWEWTLAMLLVQQHSILDPTLTQLPSGTGDLDHCIIQIWNYQHAIRNFCMTANPPGADFTMKVFWSISAQESLR